MGLFETILLGLFWGLKWSYFETRMELILQARRSWLEQYGDSSIDGEGRRTELRKKPNAQFCKIGNLTENNMLKGLVFYDFFRSTSSEAQEKAEKEVIEVVKTLEEQGLGDKKFFGGNSLGLVDISFGWLAYWCGVMEELVGTKLFEPNTFPRLHSWAQNFKEISLIKENLPDREKLSTRFKRLREKFIAADLSSHNE